LEAGSDNESMEADLESCDKKEEEELAIID
jgi:hypothetical protein